VQYYLLRTNNIWVHVGEGQNKMAKEKEYEGRARFDGQNEGKITESTPVDRYLEKESLGNQLHKHMDRENMGYRSDDTSAAATMLALDEMEEPNLQVLRGNAYIQADAWMDNLLSASYIAEENCPTNGQARVLTYVDGVLKVDIDATLAGVIDNNGNLTYDESGNMLTTAHGYLSKSEQEEIRSAIGLEMMYDSNVQLLKDIAKHDEGRNVKEVFNRKKNASGVIFAPSKRGNIVDLL
jgi:hypothetical protein